jgi:chromosome condensin MukBEF ATPase and DNA-binding subunit MukB
MVTLVVIINTIISLILLYVAWRVWKLKQVLASVANNLTAYERATYAALHNTPEAIYSSQEKIHNLRQGNQNLQLQLQQVRQIISLLLLGQQTWRRYSGQLGSKSRKNSTRKSHNSI